MTRPFLTPSVVALLDQVNANAGPPDYSPAAQRAALDGAMAALGWEGNGTADETITLVSGASVHLFGGGQAQRLAGTVVYMHGGGFVAGGAASHGTLARVLAQHIGATVALIDYRLAPEHRAPAALDDCIAGVRLLADRAAGPLAILGDSAGGALAASTALALRGEVRIELLALINPMISPAAEDDSMCLFATGFFAGARDFAAGWDAYRSLGGCGAVHDLLAMNDFADLPPTILLSNEADPVCDQGEWFAERLAGAGVTVLSLRARGLVHAAWLLPKGLPEAQLLLAVVAGAIRSTLSLAP